MDIRTWSPLRDPCTYSVKRWKLNLYFSIFWQARGAINGNWRWLRTVSSITGSPKKTIWRLQTSLILFGSMTAPKSRSGQTSSWISPRMDRRGPFQRLTLKYPFCDSTFTRCVSVRVMLVSSNVKRLQSGKERLLALSRGYLFVDRLDGRHSEPRQRYRLCVKIDFKAA